MSCKRVGPRALRSFCADAARPLHSGALGSPGRTGPCPGRGHRPEPEGLTHGARPKGACGFHPLAQATWRGQGRIARGDGGREGVRAGYPGPACPPDVLDGPGPHGHGKRPPERPLAGWRGRSRTADPYRVKNEKRDFQHLRAPRRTCPKSGERSKNMKNNEVVDFAFSDVHTCSERVFDSILTRCGGWKHGQDEAERQPG